MCQRDHTFSSAYVAALKKVDLPQFGFPAKCQRDHTFSSAYVAALKKVDLPQFGFPASASVIIPSPQHMWRP
jgi:hypothetical protein